MTRAAVLLVCALAATASGCAGRVSSQQVAVTRPRPATLSADLYKPAGDGPFPALVLLHGCSGIQPNTIAWAQWLTERGYVALVLNSFSGRGLSRLCSDSAALTGGARAPDVFAAAQHLKTLSFVDGDKLGAIGWSHGGWTVLHAARLQTLERDVHLKALVAFYPYCGDVAVYRSPVPLLMLLGAEDNWTPSEPCRLIADEARGAGYSVVAVTYPGARHGFDSAHVRQPVTIGDARRGAGATVAYSPSAHADAETQVRQFLLAQLGR